MTERGLYHFVCQAGGSDSAARKEADRLGLRVVERLTDLSAGWKIYFNDEAITEFLALSAGLQGKLFALFELLEEVGPFRIPPKRKKYLRNGIWELRVEAVEGTARALYITKAREIFVVLVFVKKTEHTPSQIMDLAEKRAKEV